MNLPWVTRLVQLIGLLQSGRGHNADSLAEVCGVSRRTIFRDLDPLRQAGVPLLFDEEQGKYGIPQAYFLPPTNFTAEEALAVLVLCYEVGGGGRLPFYGPAQSAALKLESSLPAALRDHLRESTSAVQINFQPLNPLSGQKAIYQQLVACIARRRPARMNYESLSEAASLVTKLSPYRLLFGRHSWYVIGRSSVHREVRTFHVGRIRSLEPLDEKFQLPRTFTIESYLRNAWHMIPESGPDHHVWVRFRQLVARNVAEVAWHQSQKTQFREGGTLDFRVCVSGLNEISWWILGYGDQAEVIEPAALRELVAGRAARMVAQYDGLRSAGE